MTGTPYPVPTLPPGGSDHAATVQRYIEVRVCPSMGCLAMGFIRIGQVVEMTGRDGSNEWAQIDYPSGPDGRGWVIRDAVVAPANAMSGLPFFDVLGNPLTLPTSTP